MRNKIFTSLVLLVFPLLACAQNNADLFDNKVNDVLNAHYLAYKDKEYFSGATLSIYTPNHPIKNYYIGRVSHDENSHQIDADTLFEIGSITKSFTAALILQLEKETKLHLKDTLRQWLPEYNKWSAVSLETCLNMTSGLPNYSDAPVLNAEVFHHPQRMWLDKELIHFVYPPQTLSPPLKPGFFYSNTGYVLAAMIIENITQNNFQTEIKKRLLVPADLKNTFYPLPSLDKDIHDRLAHGYGFNQYMDPELVGIDLFTGNVSWAAAAGALISNSSDVIKWVKALFVENKILDANQKKQLMKVNSTATSKPIDTVSADDPHAFGLGVIEGYDKNMGTYWFYEGQTEGFRALYIYVPSNGIIIATIFNSATNSENDHASELVKKIYQLTKDNLPQM